MMVEVLNAALHEILALRRKVEILEAQVSVFDLFARIAPPARESGWVTPDITHRLEQAIAERRRQDAAAAKAGPGDATGRPQQ
jgi:hypothetical protein